MRRWTAMLLLSLLVGCKSMNHDLVELRCENRVDPLGVDVAQPRLSWQMRSDARDVVQSAYQVRVATSVTLLEKPDLWDSGKVQSDQTYAIHYAGKCLESSQPVFWQARSWDGTGHASEWTKAQTFTMGLLNESDWQAKWITPAGKLAAATLLARKEFTVQPKLKRAVIRLCGLGQYELSINGQKLSNDLLTPGWTNYRKTCLYDTYDVTEEIKPGANAIGILLGNGMYNVIGGRYVKFKGSFGPLKLIAQLRLEFADGSTQIIGTDESWKLHAGPITFSCVYGGEDYDARMELPGWDQPNFNDSDWATPVNTTSPGGRLKGISASAPPVRAFDVLTPVKENPIKPGLTVYDLGQNASVMLRMRIKGAPGARVRITPSELLKEDGTVDRHSVGIRDAWWQYTCKGEGTETYVARFFYHGCRYLQAQITGDATIESIEGIVTHTSSDPVGDFACSNDLFNRIRTLIRWAQRSNMVSIMTDCPHRERLGWLEQTYLNGPSLRYEFDLVPLIEKTMSDMRDSQRDNGLVPTIAPEYTTFDGAFTDSPEWGSAVIQCAWQQYEWSGDTSLLESYYDTMKRYVEYLQSKTDDKGLLNHGLGDWYDLGPNRPGFAQLTPVSLVASAIFYDDLRIMAQIATLLGKTSDAENFTERSEKLCVAFNRTFWDATKQTYSTGSQCANAMPYALGLVDDANKPAVLKAVVDDIRSRGNAMTAGDVGYRYLLRALVMGGRSDVIFDMNNQSDRPGYGYQLKMGATALTEAWDAGPNSQNHFMLGHLTEWFYHDLLGIQSNGPGYQKIIIKPTPVGDITWAKGSYKSVRGEILCQWQRDGKRFTLNVTLPANTTATVYLPAKEGTTITESGKPVSVTHNNEQAIIRIGSGRYRFEVR